MQYNCTATTYSIKEKTAILRKDNLMFWYGGDVIENSRCNKI
jgi:hypothetical protein